jgi:hypothetical protein
MIRTILFNQLLSRNERYFMKKLLVCLFLVLSIPCIGMEKPTEPRTPSPKKNVRKHVENTPERIETAKVNVVNRLIEAANGCLNEQDLQREDLRELLALDLENLIEKVRGTILTNFSFEEKGVTSQMIEAELPITQEALEADSFEKNYFDPLSSPLKQEAYQALGNTEITLLQTDAIDDHAYAKTDFIVVNKEKLEQIAPTPKRKAFLLGHEGVHIANKDAARIRAAENLLKEEIKKNSLSSGKKTFTSSIEFSPNTKEKIQQYTRIAEAVADAVACNSLSLAKAAARLWQEEVKKYGEGEPTNHPSNGARLRLAESLVELHEQQQRLLDRKKQALPTGNKEERKKSRAVKRLFQETNDNEK